MLSIMKVVLIIFSLFATTAYAALDGITVWTKYPGAIAYEIHWGLDANNLTHITNVGNVLEVKDSTIGLDVGTYTYSTIVYFQVVPIMLDGSKLLTAYGIMERHGLKYNIGTPLPTPIFGILK